MANIRDVARRAGVSAGTVSNVLNRPSYVTEDTRARVLEAMAELEFQPTKTARQFRAGRERILGLALADLGNPFFVDVALAADQQAGKAGVGVVLVHSAEDPVREQNNLDLLVQQRVHGIMISPVDASNPRLERLIERGVPLVYVDRISGDRPVCFVTTDNVLGGRLAAQHLLELGHRRLAYAGGTEITPQVEDRWIGFSTAAREGGAEVERFEIDDWRVTNGRHVATELLERPVGERPTGILAANDLVAIGIATEVGRRGLRVPDDLSVIGFDDLAWVSEGATPLTTIRQQRAEIGRLAVTMLLQEIDEGEAHEHRHVVLAPELVIRDSTGAPAGS